MLFIKLFFPFTGKSHTSRLLWVCFSASLSVWASSRISESFYPCGWAARVEGVQGLDEASDPHLYHITCTINCLVLFLWSSKLLQEHPLPKHQLSLLFLRKDISNTASINFVYYDIFWINDSVIYISKACLIYLSTKDK